MSTTPLGPVSAAMTRLRDELLPTLRAAGPVDPDISTGSMTGSAPLPELVEAVLGELLVIFNDNRTLHSEVYALNEAQLSELRALALEALRTAGPEAVLAYASPELRDETRLAWLAMIGAAHSSPVSVTGQNNLRKVTRLAFYSVHQRIDFEITSRGDRARLVARKTRSVEYLQQHTLYEHVLLVRNYRDTDPVFTSRTPGFSFVERIGPEAAAPVPRLSAVEALRLRAYRLVHAVVLRVLTLSGYTKRFEGAWVLSDRREQASDNAEALVRYLTEHRPDINAWFVLDPKVAAYRRLKADGVKILPYRSLRHFALMKNARQVVSSQVDKISMQPFPPSVLGREYSFTYLKHGVIHTDHFRRFNPKLIDLIIASTQDEYRRFTEEGGGYRFLESGVALTGMPRHDRLMRAYRRLQAEGRAASKLLIMPTWRIYLGEMNEDRSWGVIDGFAESAFVRQWSAFLTDPALREACERAGVEAVFLMHPRFAPHAKHFRVPGWMQTADYQGDVPGLLASVRLAVTDYSSQAFEAAFVNAPTVYFQFDREEFYAGGHSSQVGDYDHARDGFGPVAETAPAAVEAVEQMLSGRHPRYGEWMERIEGLYEFRDERNSERVTRAIEALDADR